MALCDPRSYRDGGTNGYIRSDGHGYADGDACAFEWASGLRSSYVSL